MQIPAAVGLLTVRLRMWMLAAVVFHLRGVLEREF